MTLWSSSWRLASTTFWVPMQKDAAGREGGREGGKGGEWEGVKGSRRGRRDGREGESLSAK